MDGDRDNRGRIKNGNSRARSTKAPANGYCERYIGDNPQSVAAAAGAVTARPLIRIDLKNNNWISPTFSWHTKSFFTVAHVARGVRVRSRPRFLRTSRTRRRISRCRSATLFWRVRRMIRLRAAGHGNPFVLVRTRVDVRMRFTSPRVPSYARTRVGPGVNFKKKKKKKNHRSPAEIVKRTRHVTKFDTKQTLMHYIVMPANV